MATLCAGSAIVLLDQVRDVSIDDTFQSWHGCEEDDLFSSRLIDGAFCLQLQKEIQRDGRCYTCITLLLVFTYEQLGFESFVPADRHHGRKEDFLRMVALVSGRMLYGFGRITWSECWFAI